MRANITVRRLEMLSAWHALESNLATVLFAATFTLLAPISILLVSGISGLLPLVVVSCANYALPIYLAFAGVGFSLTATRTHLLFLLPISRSVLARRRIVRRLFIAAFCAALFASYLQEPWHWFMEMTLRYFAILALTGAVPRRWTRHVLSFAPFLVIALVNLPGQKGWLTEPYAFGVLPTAIVAVAAAWLLVRSTRQEETT